MVFIFLVSLLLYYIAYVIFSCIKGFSPEDYDIVEVGSSFYKRPQKVLKETAVPKRFKIKLWIVIVGIICFLIPIINVIAGIVFIALALIFLNDEDDAEFYPNKFMSAINNFFVKEL